MDHAVPQKAKIQPSMYRVYKSTVQRVPVNIKSLSSHASFLITLDGEKQVIAWIGSDCESSDADLVKELGLGVMTKDYRLKDTTDVPVILEGSEPVPLLEAVLEIFWSNSNTYFSKLTSSERKQKITNNSVSVGLIEKLSTGSEVYDFQETAFAHPDARGTVPRVTFVPIEMKTIAYVNVGEQWDIWISRGINEEEERNVMIFLENAISSQIALGSTAFKKEVLSQYIQVARQGEERFLFRRPLKIFTDFEPPGKTAPKSEPRIKVKAADKKDASKEEEKKETEAAASTPSNTSSSLKSGAAALKGGTPKGGISFKPEVAFFETEPDSAQSPGNATSSPYGGGEHQYVDFYSVTGRGHHEEKSKDGGGTIAMSDITLHHQGGDSQLGELDDPSGQQQAPSAGDRVVTPAMLQLVDKLNIGPEERSNVIKESARNPDALIGYQVEIDEGIFAGIFVITKTKKTLFHKTMYHLSAGDGDEFWLRLQRGPGKRGQKFRPLRRVLVV